MDHVLALDAGGRRLVDRPLPNGEPELVALFAELEAHGRVLVVVDQLASIGALAVAVRMGEVVCRAENLAARRGLGGLAHRSRSTSSWSTFDILTT